MIPFFDERFGNPSSNHSDGQLAREGVEEGRENVANLLGASTRSIIFTSGGSESDNTAIKGVAWRKKGRHLITSIFEHPAVLNTCKYLERNDREVSYIPVDTGGIVDLDRLQEAIRPDTVLISIMTANNEIGTIQPIRAIGEIAHDKGILFHTDAVQAFGKIPIDVEKDNIDLLSLSSHKLHGPKGVGALFVREGVTIEPLIHGGGHEFGMRSSTENVPGIAGLGMAAKIAGAEMEEEMGRLKGFRDRVIDRVTGGIMESYLNGSRTSRLSNNANIGFRWVEGESILLLLDQAGISVSTGSACSSKSLRPSATLLALGLRPEEVHGSIRVSMGRFNTSAEVDRLIEVLPPIIERLRAMSPLSK